MSQINRNGSILTAIVFVVAAICICLGGCASLESIERSPEPTIEGRWKGTWLSDTNGHTGDLWCIVRRTDDDAYTASFRGTYGEGIGFAYNDVPIVIERDGSLIRFTSQSDLGDQWGGNFTSEGIVDGDVFHSTYDSAFDKGTFNMTRMADAGDQSPGDQ